MAQLVEVTVRPDFKTPPLPKLFYGLPYTSLLEPSSARTRTILCLQQDREVKPILQLLQVSLVGDLSRPPPSPSSTPQTPQIIFF